MPKAQVRAPKTTRDFSPLLTPRAAQTKSGELANNFISGAVGGFVGTAVNTPCAFTPCSLSWSHPLTHPCFSSRRRQVSSPELYQGASLHSLPGSPSYFVLPKVAGQTPKYNWTFPSLALIAREEGIGALYSGFLPKVLRLAPGGGVLLLVVEFTLGVFRKQLGAPYL